MSTNPGLPGRLALAALALTLAACSQGPEVGPPAEWESDGQGRYWAPGTDTEAAFRDLDSIDGMGVATDAGEFERWGQDQLVEIYRSNPEVVDSVYDADFAEPLRTGVAASGDDPATRDALVNDMKRDFYQRYNNSRKEQTALALPDSLARLSGDVVLNVYVRQDDARAEAGDEYPFVPLAVEVVEGTGTGLDLAAVGDAARARYTSAWVRTGPGNSAGVPVANWVRITRSFGDA